MKKLKRLVYIFLAILLLVGCSTTTNSYDAQILNTAKEVINQWGYIPNRTYSVDFDGSIYTVDINGSEQQILIPENSAESKKVDGSTLAKEEPDAKLARIVEDSKKLVSSYIEASDILKNKPDIVNYVSNIPTYVVEMEYVAMYDAGALYINTNHTHEASEWMIVHELVHAICEFTNGGIENERYPYNLFNEVMTDIITASMNPSSADGTMSGYAIYHEIGYAFIGCFGEKALSSYFYGYDSLVEELGYELDFFVFSMENMEKNEIALICVNNSINHWQEIVK